MTRRPEGPEGRVPTTSRSGRKERRSVSNEREPRAGQTGFVIEPLGASSWQRIERGIFNELDNLETLREPLARGAGNAGDVVDARRRFRPLHIGFAAAGAVALAAALVLVLAGPRLLGSSLDDNPSMITPSRVVTAAAPTRITVGRAVVDIAPYSTVWVNSTADQGTMLVLEKGRVDCAVVHREDQPPFVVEAGDVRVEVVGTRFAVARHEHTARVEVTQGTVQVFHDGELALVHEGEVWPASPTESAESDSAASDSQGKQASASSAGRHHRRKSSSASEPDEEPLSAKDRYETAAILEASDPAAAMAIYRGLAREGSVWSANALYARARLEHEQGNRKIARRLLVRYLARYPRGPNAADARALLGQIDNR